MLFQWRLNKVFTPQAAPVEPLAPCQPEPAATLPQREECQTLYERIAYGHALAEAENQADHHWREH